MNLNYWYRLIVSQREIAEQHFVGSDGSWYLTLRGSLTRRNKIRVAIYETPCLSSKRCVTVKRKESTAILRSRAILISGFFYIGNFLLRRIHATNTLETCGFWKTRARVDFCRLRWDPFRWMDASLETFKSLAIFFEISTKCIPNDRTLNNIR